MVRPAAGDRGRPVPGHPAPGYPRGAHTVAFRAVRCARRLGRCAGVGSRPASSRCAHRIDPHFDRWRAERIAAGQRRDEAVDGLGGHRQHVCRSGTRRRSLLRFALRWQRIARKQPRFGARWFIQLPGKHRIAKAFVLACRTRAGPGWRRGRNEEAPRRSRSRGGAPKRERAEAQPSSRTSRYVRRNEAVDSIR
jgi:hypothetical protein